MLTPILGHLHGGVTHWWKLHQKNRCFHENRVAPMAWAQEQISNLLQDPGFLIVLPWFHEKTMGKNLGHHSSRILPILQELWFEMYKIMIFHQELWFNQEWCGYFLTCGIGYGMVKPQLDGSIPCTWKDRTWEHGLARQTIVWSGFVR